jgi:hypothetical protein
MSFKRKGHVKKREIPVEMSLEREGKRVFDANQEKRHNPV